ncbi:hypothetical protein [uncultured Sulfitobacter sp.]|uniref:hypothetical protein n=1 Tax=uncultured Sulfitobacter sp. TaxID=191468 RepID=UPI002602F1BF|nr:hypothetical protein [uncultured Sulfitobacter sp.]
MPVNMRLFIYEYGVLVGSGVAFLITALWVFMFFKPDRHSHAGYLPAEVISTFDTTSDNGFS